jgi:hypothetical protein
MGLKDGDNFRNLRGSLSFLIAKRSSRESVAWRMIESAVLMSKRGLCEIDRRLWPESV